MYLSIIDASGWYGFFTYPFNIFMYLLIGYIHLKNIGPHILISLTRWIIKWTMMSKNEGGKYILSWHKITIASFSKSSNVARSITFWQILLKNMQRRVMTCLTLLGKMPRITTGRSCWMRTWQSWDFKPTSFKSFIETRLFNIWRVSLWYFHFS